jgi:hypothetical protein
MVTGEAPILHGRGSIHIVEFVKGKFDDGNIQDVIDSRLEGEYEMMSVHKVVELAMLCTSEKSIQRPTMADVIVSLKDSVQMEEHRQKGMLQPSDKSDTNTKSTSTSFGNMQSFDLTLI